MAEFAFFQEIRRKDHVDKVIDLMSENDYILFDSHVVEKFKKSETEEEKHALVTVIFPQVQVFWAYVVLLCRTLFDGEHPISLEDALFLGLIDELAGRTFPEPKRSVRNKRIAREKQAQEKANQPQRKWLRPRKGS